MPLPPKTCRQCGKALTQHQQFSGGLCEHWRCREAELAAQSRQYRDHCLAQAGEPTTPELPITVVPWHQRQTGPLEPEVVATFSQHLEDLLATLDQEPTPAARADDQPDAPASIEPDPVDTNDPGPLLGRICGACEGYCCFHGASRQAFLDLDTLRRGRAQRPDLPIKALYLSYLPDEHYLGSCVYHTRQGCNLPRELRAEICNTYECRGLKQARDSLTEAPGERLFVVARDNNVIKRGLLISPGDLKDISLS